MPNTKSAKKRLRQNEARRIHRKSVKNSVRTQIKKVHTAVKEGDIELAEKEFALAAQKLDKAGAKKIYHKNTAARYKSRLSKLITTSKASATA
ncbi:MAG: 30S ribosomal protein S20 [Pirellulaceae bacterium]|nr:30S ribosomal protein S20 [Pirellulaceae bacterium]